MTPPNGWLSWPYYNPGAPNLVLVPEGTSFGIMADADWDMAQAILQDLKAPEKFLNPTDSNYATPITYATLLIATATNLTQNATAKYTVPANWNSQAKGLQYAQIVFGILQQIAVNLSDPNTVDVFTAWLHGTGNLYGGHPPISDVSTVSAPSSSAQVGTILGGGA